MRVFRADKNENMLRYFFGRRSEKRTRQNTKVEMHFVRLDQCASPYSGGGYSRQFLTRGV